MITDSPTSSPVDFEFPAETPAPSMVVPAPTNAPFDMFPATPSPTVPAPVATEAPAAVEVSDCECVNNMSEEEMAVLIRRSKNMVCDPTCDGSDPIWGTWALGGVSLLCCSRLYLSSLKTFVLRSVFAPALACAGTGPS